MIAESVASVHSALSAPPAGVLDAIVAQAGPLLQVELAYEPEPRLLWLTLRPEPKPVFTLTCVDSVRRVQRAVKALWGADPDSPVRFLAYRASGPIFSLGGDLDFYLDCLATNDRAGLADYAETAAEVILGNRTGLGGAVITLAAVQGKALGGGIDPARACNLMVAEESACFCYPEINYNHFPISAVPILSRHAGPIEAERILMSGEGFTAREFAARGVVDAVVADGEGEAWVRAYALRTLPTHRARAALFAAFERRSGDLTSDLAEGARAWVDHIMRLKPLDISKLQRIAQAQERLLLRRPRAPKAALEAPALEAAVIARVAEAATLRAGAHA